LSEFKKLKHIFMDGSCIPFESALQDARTAPPNMSTYKLKGDIFPRSERLDPGEVARRYRSSFRWLIKTAQATPSLERVDLVTDHKFVPNADAKAAAITTAGQEFEGLGTHLFVHRYKTITGGLPPYLDGKPRVREELLFESETGTFHQWDESIGLDEVEESEGGGGDSDGDQDVRSVDEDGTSSSEDSD
jgi:hypothetical protein